MSQRKPDNSEISAGGGRSKQARRAGSAARRLDFETLEERHLLAIDVTTTADVSNPGDGVTSLREAIAAAVSGDVINFSVNGIFNLSNNHLSINKNLTIEGPGANLVTIRAFNPDGIGDGDGRRAFLIDNGNNNSHLSVTLSGLTITNGDPQEGDENTGGGAILNRENLTISECIITGNDAANGGGIYSRFGTVAISDSTISGNGAEDGGGLLLESGTATVLRSTFANNYAGNEGGGVFQRGGDLSITDSTISDNGADLYGGGISTHNGDITITGSTVSGNTANERGGGIYIYEGAVTIAHSTITANSISSGGHSGGGIASGDPVSLTHTIVAGNLRGSSTRDDISTSTEHAGSGSFSALFSLIGDRRSVSVNNQGGSLIGSSTSGSTPPINALLGPLANNGGPTMTHELLTGSPAIDAGDGNAEAGVNDIPSYDQRGTPFSRVADGNGVGGDRIDIGAFEVPTPPMPAEIAVTGNGQDIADGDTSPSTSDDTDFGSTPHGGATVSRTFTVRNDGTGTLTLGAVSVPGGYTVTDPLVTSLGAGASDTLTVRLDTTTAGTKTGDVSFTTNDSDETTFNFSITGVVTIPEIAVTGNGQDIADGDTSPSTSDDTDFGSTPHGGATVSRTFTVRNDGTGTLTLGAVSVPGGYTVTDPLVTSLGAGASDTLTVRLDTTTAGTKTGDVSFTTNDSDETTFNFSITGVVSTPELPGDYNLNTVVDAADYVLWRKTSGSSVPPYSGADGNGDEIIDAVDYGIWTENFGETSPLEAGAGGNVASRSGHDFFGLGGLFVAPQSTQSSGHVIQQDSRATATSSPDLLLVAASTGAKETESSEIESGSATLSPRTTADLDEAFAALTTDMLVLNAGE